MKLHAFFIEREGEGWFDLAYRPQNISFSIKLSKKQTDFDVKSQL